MGLVHMNGRVYDPVVGRFMSADPTVPDPLDGQSFNRYAYVENNPLSAVDPSGYCQTELCEWLPTGPGGSLEEYNVGSLGGSGNYFQQGILSPLAPLNDDVVDQAATTYIAPPPTVPPIDTTPSSAPLPIPTGSGNNGSAGSGNNNLGSGNFLLPVPPAPCQYGSNCGGNNGVQQAMNDTNGVQNVSFGDIDWGTMGSGKLRAPPDREGIPNPNTPIGGGPSVGARNAIGSQGISLGTKLDLFGGIAGYAEYSHRVGGMWKGMTGKWYSLDWGGNGATGARGLASGFADASHAASDLSFALSVGVNGYRAYNAYETEKNWKGVVGQSVVDTLFSGVMAFGGLPGFAMGGIYFTVQDTIGWNNVFKAYDQFYAQFPNWSSYGYGGYNGP